ncbi:MAG: enoyl-CoA hydratase [Flavobacterium sp. BFFFF2]|nr:MAG: enoyl-CoA hydratase [Flavobacterium sp. BFFFF2]
MSTDHTGSFLDIQTDRGIAFVTFAHPAGNSFPSAQLQATEYAFRQLATDQSVKAIVLQSNGSGPFCAGASFDELLAVTNEAEGLAFFSGFARVINAMRRCPQWIIGRVQGKTVGGGVGLAAACDVVFATEKAAVKLSEIAIGIGPFVIEPAVSRKIGSTAMSALAFVPDQWKSAAWALEKGLYNEVFETEQLMDEALQLYLEQLRNYHRDAMKSLKEITWQGTEHWDQLLLERAAISGQLVLSDFTKNALNQFKKK